MEVDVDTLEFQQNEMCDIMEELMELQEYIREDGVLLRKIAQLIYRRALDERAEICAYLDHHFSKPEYWRVKVAVQEITAGAHKR